MELFFIYGIGRLVDHLSKKFPYLVQFIVVNQDENTLNFPDFNRIGNSFGITGFSLQALLIYDRALTEEEIEKMKKDAEANAESDKKAKENADKLNSADQMIFQTESQLKEFGDKLSDAKKKPIEVALEELKKAYETKDISLNDPA